MDMNMDTDSSMVIEENQALLRSESPDAEQATGNTLKREITFPYAFAISVSAISGTSIYITPSLVAQVAPDMFTAILIWICAGFIALVSALCYCEVSSVVQKTGATFIFVRECYGETIGFLVTWLNVVLVIPFLLAFMFENIGSYATAPFFQDHKSHSFKWCSKAVSISLLFGLSAVSVMGVNKSAKVTYAVNMVQVVLFSACIGMGIHYTVVSEEPSNLAPEIMFKPAAWSNMSSVVPNLGMGVFNALVSYEGWYIISTFVEEIKNPARNLPLLTITVLPFITFIFVAVNVVMLTVLSQQEMASCLRLFTTFAVKASGKSMGYVVSAFIPVCGVAGLLGYLYHFSRVCIC